MKNCTECGDEFTKPEMKDMCRAWHEQCSECYRQGLLETMQHIKGWAESEMEKHND